MSSEVLISALHLLSCVHGPAKHSHSSLLWSQPQVWSSSPGEAKRGNPVPSSHQLALEPASFLVASTLAKAKVAPEAGECSLGMQCFCFRKGGGKVQPAGLVLHLWRVPHFLSLVLQPWHSGKALIMGSRTQGCKKGLEGNPCQKELPVPHSPDNTHTISASPAPLCLA